MTERDPRELADQLRTLRRERDSSMRAEFNRSLPFGELLFDRWQRAEALGFGDGASVYDSCVLFGDVQVGDHTWIGPYTVLDGSGGGLRIGRYCSISAGVHVYTHDTVAWSLSLGEVERRTGAVTIGDGCYLGSQVVVTAGVSIGDQCVVGTNSVVLHDVPDRTVVAGSPARPIGRVEGADADVRIVWDAPGTSAQ